jgi:hypothetical protein
MAAIFAAIDPPSVRGLVLLSTPLCFELGSCRFRDALVAVAPRTPSVTQIVPGSLLSQLSVMASPESFLWSRLIDAALSIGDPAYWRSMLGSSAGRWTNFPFPGGWSTRPFSGSIAKTAFAPELSRSGIKSSDLRRSDFPCLRSSIPPTQSHRRDRSCPASMPCQGATPASSNIQARSASVSSTSWATGTRGGLARHHLVVAYPGMRRKGFAPMRPDFVPGEGQRSRAAMSGAEGTTDARRAPLEGNLAPFRPLADASRVVSGGWKPAARQSALRRQGCADSGRSRGP